MGLLIGWTTSWGDLGMGTAMRAQHFRYARALIHPISRCQSNGIRIAEYNVMWLLFLN